MFTIYFLCALLSILLQEFSKMLVFKVCIAGSWDRFFYFSFAIWYVIIEQIITFTLKMIQNKLFAKFASFTS